MTRTEGRLDRIECDVSLRVWFRAQRMFETMTIEELKTLATLGQWPDRPEPDPGTSNLDLLNRPCLIQRWREHLETFPGRTSDELEFYAVHGNWPREPGLEGRS